MKEAIIDKSCELFLNLGFKSITMDEIANAMGVSKKTIYKYFNNKTDLVTEVTNTMFEKISCGIDQVCGIDMNPIDEIFAIKKLVMEHLKDEKSSPQWWGRSACWRPSAAGRWRSPRGRRAGRRPRWPGPAAVETAAAGPSG